MIITKASLLLVRKELKENGKSIVFTNGCFDIIHAGHVKYLNDARKLGDILIIGLNSDSSVKRLKGKGRPVNTESDRALVLDSLKPVDFTCMFNEDTPFELIQAILPDTLVKGGDYKIDDIVGGDIVRANGGKVETIPFVEGKSTTSLIDKLKSGQTD